tara:strand:- start:1456 stop:1905 length:450 start_codon:yes stop_codon:yes gene_type:complete
MNYNPKNSTVKYVDCANPECNLSFYPKANKKYCGTDCKNRVNNPRRYNCNDANFAPLTNGKELRFEMPLREDSIPVLKELDTINPSHYTNGKVECIDAIKSAVTNKRPEEAVLVGNIIKYLWRYEEKGGIESINKAKWYLDDLIKEHKQ